MKSETAFGSYLAAWNERQALWYAEQTESHLVCSAAGAWMANDREGFVLAHAELRRRRLGGTLRANRRETWQQNGRVD